MNYKMCMLVLVALLHTVGSWTDTGGAKSDLRDQIPTKDSTAHRSWILNKF